MLRLNGSTFINATSTLAYLRSWLETHVDSGDEKISDEDSKEMLTGTLRSLRNEVVLVGANLTAMVIDRAIEQIEKGECTEKKLGENIKTIQGRLEDELTLTSLMVLERDKAAYYDLKEPIFSEDVDQRLPKEIIDHFKEANKCYALDRYSACIYHLMGTLDITFKCIAKSLNTSIDIFDPKLDWEKIIHNIQAGITSMSQSQPKKWKKKEVLFEGLLLDIRAIRRVVRNPSAHYRETYTAEDALKFLNAIKTFMTDYAKVF